MARSHRGLLEDGTVADGSREAGDQTFSFQIDMMSMQRAMVVEKENPSGHRGEPTW